MSRFNEERSKIGVMSDRLMDARQGPTETGPRAWQALAALASSMVLVTTVGAALLSSPRLRYSGLMLTELLCVGAPSAILALAGRHDLTRLFRLKAPRR